MNKQTLAREILDSCTTRREYCRLNSIEKKAEQLAELILTEPPEDSEEVKEALIYARIIKAKQEQKEKDAEIVRRKGKMYMAETAFNQIANEIISDQQGQ